MSNYICTPQAPYAKQVSIIGERYIGAKLTASYTYYDMNNDAEDTNNTVYAWYISDREDSGFALIPGATGAEYEVKAADVNKYIYVKVTPASTDAPYTSNNDEYGKSAPVLAAAQAQIKNVDIKKTGTGTYTVYYEYHHPNGISEGTPEISWHVNGEATAFDNKTITVGSSVSGTLSVKVTVCASKAPIEGQTGSDSITLSSKSTAVRPSSGGGGGGGGGFSNFVPLPEKKEEAPQQPVEVRHWAADGIDFCKAQGIMQDPVPGDFKNAAIVTRAELVSYIIKTLGAKETAYTHMFKDVSGTDYFSGALQTAVNLGIISEAENFEPHRHVTRQEVSKILVTAFGQEIAESADLTKFADMATISEWARDYVAKSVAKGIFKGVSDDTFDPLGSITREQTAVVLKRLYDLRNGGTIG